ncbi:MAG: winged helix-turn-helix transcriptional regulator [Oscillospiraceae bacterium]|nr:winged helix-turn-helix transcriptional regulator [Oscillospiraceae bacterium]MBQ6849839.1 winged helix-turn-helix transcriptional regulator [Oscillospiraceae bacterium]MBR6609165.1 winged helix-turn-helix transcriptional regulator [Oscillospiraceae bacterium]
MDAAYTHSMIDINMSVNQIKGSLVQMAKKYDVNYHEMVLMYHLYRNGDCTQKQLCDYYLLPKQTVNNIVMAMKGAGNIDWYFTATNKKEKVLTITEKGMDYISSLVLSMNSTEETIENIMGAEKMSTLVELLGEYNSIIKASIASL